MSQFLNSKSLCLSVFFSQNEPKICCHRLLFSRHMLDSATAARFKKEPLASCLGCLTRRLGGPSLSNHSQPSAVERKEGKELLQNDEFGRYLTLGWLKSNTVAAQVCFKVGIESQRNPCVFRPVTIYTLRFCKFSLLPGTRHQSVPGGAPALFWVVSLTPGTPVATGPVSSSLRLFLGRRFWLGEPRDAAQPRFSSCKRCHRHVQTSLVSLTANCWERKMLPANPSPCCSPVTTCINRLLHHKTQVPPFLSSATTQRPQMKWNLIHMRK